MSGGRATRTRILAQFAEIRNPNVRYAVSCIVLRKRHRAADCRPVHPGLRAGVAMSGRVRDRHLKTLATIRNEGVRCAVSCIVFWHHPLVKWGSVFDTMALRWRPYMHRDKAAIQRHLSKFFKPEKVTQLLATMEGGYG